MTYGIALHILRNRDKYSTKHIREAEALIKEVNIYRTCPSCGEGLVSLRLINLGYYCPQCTRWKNTYERQQPAPLELR